MKTMYIVLIVIGVAGAAFYGGMQYQKHQSRSQFPGGPQSNRQFNGQRGGQFQMRNAQGTNAVIGEIISKDDNSITVKTQDGSSKIIIISDSTTINKAATGTKDDLRTGERVALFGNTNAEGVMTAQSVQLNPQMRREFMQSPAPSAK